MILQIDQSSLPTAQTLTQFLDLDLPEEGIYEWVDGAIVRKQASRGHDIVADGIAAVFRDEVKRLDLPYRVSGRAVVRTIGATGREQGRQPDVSVVDKAVWDSDRSAPTAFIEPIPLAVEVISSNWEDDYIDKLEEYQRLGIPEYWIVDSLALGSRALLGNPKRPTVFVYRLSEAGIYQPRAFTGSEPILSFTFPQLQLTAEQVLEPE